MTETAISFEAIVALVTVVGAIAAVVSGLVGLAYFIAQIRTTVNVLVAAMGKLTSGLEELTKQVRAHDIAIAKLDERFKAHEEAE